MLGAAGELTAVQARYDRGPAGKPSGFPLWAIFVLTFAVWMPPFLRLRQDTDEPASVVDALAALAAEAEGGTPPEPGEAEV